MLARMIFATLALDTVMMSQPRTANAAPYWPWCSQYGGGNSAPPPPAVSRLEGRGGARPGLGGSFYNPPHPPPPPPPARPPKPPRPPPGAHNPTPLFSS